MNNQQKLEFYRTYYNNLSPEPFTVQIDDGKIIISNILSKKLYKKGGQAKTWKQKYNKKTLAFDVNSDGKVDIEDVKIVMEEANKSKKATKKEDISKESRGKFNRKIRKQGVRPSDVSVLALEHLGEGCKVVWDKNKSRLFHIVTKSGEKLPEKGLYSL